MDAEASTNARVGEASQSAPGWAEGERRLKVFISYSRRDSKDFANRLVSAFGHRGLAAVIDERDLKFGHDWQEQLKDFIRQADAVVFVISPKSIASTWCRWEAAEVALQSKRLVPVRHIDVPIEQLPPEIGKIELFPASKEADFSLRPDDFENLLNALSEGLQSDRGWLQQHTALVEDAFEWTKNCRSQDRLLRGQALASAERWMLARPEKAPPPSQSQLEFIAASQAEAKRRARRWISGLIAIVAGALVLAGAAVWQWQEAVKQRIQAEFSNAKISASYADSLLQSGRRREAIKTLVDATPKSAAGVPPVLDAAIYRALWWRDERVSVPAVSFSSIDHAKVYGQLALLASSEGQTIALVDFKTGKTVQHFLTHPGQVKASAMSTARDRLAIVTEIGQRPALREFLVASDQPFDGPDEVDVPVEVLTKPAFIWFDQESDLIKKVGFANGAKMAWEGTESVALTNIDGIIRAISQNQKVSLTQIGDEMFVLDLKSKEKRLMRGASTSSVYSLAPDGGRLIEFVSEPRSVRVWTLHAEPVVVSRADGPAGLLLLGEGPEDAWSAKGDRYALINDGIDIYCLPDFHLCQKIAIGEWSALALGFDETGSVLRVIMQPPGRFGVSLAEIRLDDLGYTYRIGNLEEFVCLADGSAVIASTSSELAPAEEFAPVETVPNSGKILVLQAGTVSEVSRGDYFRSLVQFKDKGFGVLSSYRPAKVTFDARDASPTTTFEVGDAPQRVVSAGDAILLEEDGKVTSYAFTGEKGATVNVGSFERLSSDGRYFSGFDENGIFVAQPMSGQKLIEMPLGDDFDVRLVEHGFALVQPRLGEVIVKDLSGKVGDRTVHVGDVNLKRGNAAVDAEGNRLAISDRGAITIYNLKTGQNATVRHEASLDVGISDHVGDIYFLPGSEFVISGGSDGKVKLWTSGGMFVADLASFDHGVTKLEIDRSGRRFCARSESEIVMGELLPVPPKERLQRALEIAQESPAPSPP